MPTILFRLSLVVLVAVSASASAQTEARRPSWVSVSAQGGVSDKGASVEYSVLTGGLSVQLHRPLGSGPLRLQAGATLSSEVIGTSIAAETHVALGTSVSAGPLFLSAVAGPSVGGEQRGGSGEGGVRPFAGLYGGVRADVAVLPLVGIGVEAFGNLNAVRPSTGLGLSLTFGRRAGALIR